MTNAKEGFIEEVKGCGKPICAKIGVDKENYGSNIKWSILKKGYSKKDYEVFLESLDYEYDSGYGSQELFGKILFENSYSDRHEYDGSEYWDNHKMPTVKNIMGMER